MNNLHICLNKENPYLQSPPYRTSHPLSPALHKCQTDNMKFVVTRPCRIQNSLVAQQGSAKGTARSPCLPLSRTRFSQLNQPAFRCKYSFSLHWPLTVGSNSHHKLLTWLINVIANFNHGLILVTSKSNEPCQQAISSIHHCTIAN